MKLFQELLLGLAIGVVYGLLLIGLAGPSPAWSAEDKFAVAEALPHPLEAPPRSCAEVIFWHVRTRPYLPNANDVEIDALWLHVAKLEALLLTISDEVLELRRCVDAQAEGGK
jgi:hypothetical protein